VLMTTDTPPQTALRDYLLRRSHSQPAESVARVMAEKAAAR